MLELECVGTVKGPGETPHEYTFIAPDPERRVKHGEFVFYEAWVEGETRAILGRVTARRAVRKLVNQRLGKKPVAQIHVVRV